MKTYRKIQHSGFALVAAVIGLGILGQFTSVHAGKANRSADAIWVHDSLYGTVATDTSFKSPPAHSTDVIFSFADGGLRGQRSVAVYAPGDTEYNGGRWNVMAVSYTPAGIALFDTDDDGAVDTELTNAEDLLEAAEMGLLTITETGVYFECPLLEEPTRH